MRLSPFGMRDCNLAIQASSVLSLTLMFPLVDVTIIAETSFTLWLFVEKWRDTGLSAFSCLISDRRFLNLSLNVLLDWPTYCRLHLVQVMT